MNERNIKTRGRHARPIQNPYTVIGAVVRFLQMFMTETLAKRIVSVVLLAVGIPNARITEATGLSDRSIWSLKSAINSGNIDDIFASGHGSGRPGKAKGFEDAIVEELESSN